MSGIIRLHLDGAAPDWRAALVEPFESIDDIACLEAGLSETDILEQADAILVDGRHEGASVAWREAGFSGPILCLGGAPNAEGEAILSLSLPLRVVELAARIRAAVRNHQRSDGAAFAFGPYHCRPAERALVREGEEPIRLTDLEAGILDHLHRADGRLMNRDELLARVWGYKTGVTTHTLETHIYRLRQKIGRISGVSGGIVTEEGGYRLLDARDIGGAPGPEDEQGAPPGHSE
ncbi:DNA-binding response regulator [Parvularcula bermudensis HTCC2503]|uniref:DNA-binding response regulator n=1 Tax=Parvularcula bermudensis (strain ATCC BAA-594 / HTCC2503 / KCTC 12087) TaxID=314260 RepID=E0TFA5_PARBH|nr:winged helix-turn-helix domain-containing protein [Parvularcula bermudensis]ADM09023.1 DNA-binding response regulator [Parvularcula bermudensis HTCC2503]